MNADLPPPPAAIIQEYDPSQPRVAAGSSRGGQWSAEYTTDGGPKRDSRRPSRKKKRLKVVRGKQLPQGVRVYTSPGLDGLSKDLVSFLRSYNLPTGDFKIVVTDPVADDDPRTAYSTPGVLAVPPVWEAALGALIARRDGGKQISNVNVIHIVLHEAIHQIRGASFAADPEGFRNGRWLEEGLTESMTIDLGQRFVSELFGTGSRDQWTRGVVTASSPYKDQVVAVRKASARATGKPWTTPEAFAWRAKMLQMSFAERQAEWERVQSLPMPTRSTLAESLVGRVRGGDGADLLREAIRQSRLTESERLRESIVDRILRYGKEVLVHRAPDGTFTSGGGGPVGKRVDVHIPDGAEKLARRAAADKIGRKEQIRRVEYIEDRMVAAHRVANSRDATAEERKAANGRMASLHAQRGRILDEIETRRREVADAQIAKGTAQPHAPEAPDLPPPPERKNLGMEPTVPAVKPGRRKPSDDPEAEVPETELLRLDAERLKARQGRLDAIAGKLPAQSELMPRGSTAKAEKARQEHIKRRRALMSRELDEMGREVRERQAITASRRTIAKGVGAQFDRRNALGRTASIETKEPKTDLTKKQAKVVRSAARRMAGTLRNQASRDTREDQAWRRTQAVDELRQRADAIDHMESWLEGWQEILDAKKDQVDDTFDEGQLAGLDNLTAFTILRAAAYKTEKEWHDSPEVQAAWADLEQRYRSTGTPPPRRSDVLGYHPDEEGWQKRWDKVREKVAAGEDASMPDYPGTQPWWTRPPIWEREHRPDVDVWIMSGPGSAVSGDGPAVRPRSYQPNSRAETLAHRILSSLDDERVGIYDRAVSPNLSIKDLETLASAPRDPSKVNKVRWRTAGHDVFSTALQDELQKTETIMGPQGPVERTTLADLESRADVQAAIKRARVRAMDLIGAKPETPGAVRGTQEEIAIAREEVRRLASRVDEIFGEVSRTLRRSPEPKRTAYGTDAPDAPGGAPSAPRSAFPRGPEGEGPRQQPVSELSPSRSDRSITRPKTRTQVDYDPTTGEPILDSRRGLTNNRTVDPETGVETVRPVRGKLKRSTVKITPQSVTQFMGLIQKLHAAETRLDEATTGAQKDKIRADIAAINRRIARLGGAGRLASKLEGDARAEFRRMAEDINARRARRP